LKICGKREVGVVCTLDVETISINKIQTPIAISFAYRKLNKVNSFVKIIDYELLKIDKETAVQNLWKEFFDSVKELNISSNLFIYSHNLGSFDGYFILPALYKYCRSQNINPLIDDQNKFISIKYRYSIKPYDSLTEEELASKGLSGHEVERIEIKIDN